MAIVWRRRLGGLLPADLLDDLPQVLADLFIEAVGAAADALGTFCAIALSPSSSLLLLLL